MAHANQYTGKNHLVRGVGINDLPNEPIEWTENGKRVRCPKYVLWNAILQRCYRPGKSEIIAYKGVTVHPDWIYRSKFNEWLNSQPQNNWQELQIDKDLLVKGNKVYGPDTCCFLTNQENNVFRPLTSDRLGSAAFDKSKNYKKPWRAMITQSGIKRNFGYFSTKEEAEFVAMREFMPYVIEIANANPHRFIRDAMYRWIDDWKQELAVLEEKARVATSRNALPLFEIK
jgi:hypothetical protein